MKGIYNFVIEPVGERYNNVKKIGDKDLILNTKMFTHQFVNREGLVLETPIIKMVDHTIKIISILFFMIKYFYTKEII